MTSVRERHWFFILLHCFLIGSLVDSSSLSSAAHFLSVTSKVGNQVVLPCSWKSRLGEVAPPTCHIQWNTPVDTVFEQRGKQKWQAVDFKGRVEVPEEKLGSGDCSLIINDVQIKDTGSYESFMLVDSVVDNEKTRVFIQSVKLSVFDHKTRKSHAPDEDLVLNLYTSHSVRVVFQGRNSSEWSVLWTKGDSDSERVVEDPDDRQLTLKKLKRSDDGIYKVLDELGLAVSTVQLSVEEKSTSRRTQENTESQAAADDATKSSSSTLLILSVLVLNLL